MITLPGIDPDPNPALLRTAPGRSLVLSPAWPDEGASVVFDRHSGDYWVVSPLARAFVEMLAHEAEKPAADLLAEASHAFPSDSSVTPGVAAQVLQELIQLGVLAAVPAVADRTDRESRLA